MISWGLWYKIRIHKRNTKVRSKVNKARNNPQSLEREHHKGNHQIQTTNTVAHVRALSHIGYQHEEREVNNVMTFLSHSFALF